MLKSGGFDFKTSVIMDNSRTCYGVLNDGDHLMVYGAEMESIEKLLAAGGVIAVHSMRYAVEI
jgi:hypothetical protein